MKTFSAIVLSFTAFISALFGSEALDRARQLANSGDSLGARTALAQAAQRSPNDVGALMEYAEFLDRYGDSAARGAYEKVLEALGPRGDAEKRAAVLRRLLTLDLLAGDHRAAQKHREAFQAAGGLGLASAAAPQDPAGPTVTIPGPLRSFGRMAAISSDLTPDEVLGALARNVVTS